METREAENGLMLGVCGQVIRNPERFEHPVCWKTVEVDGVLALAGIMTPPHRLILAGTPVYFEGCAAALAEYLAGEGWEIPGVIGLKGVSRAVTARLAQAYGKRCRLDQTLRLYELRKVDLPQPPRGRLRTASVEDLEWIAAWWYAARREMLGREDPDDARQAAKARLEDGDVFFWDDGGPLSMACKTRPTKTGISIGMIFTPPEQRRRGFATACVGELSRKLLGEGRAFCALFADLANPVSNRAYRRVGYRPIGDFEDYSFVEAM